MSSSSPRRLRLLAFLLVLPILLLPTAVAEAQTRGLVVPSFSKAFSPSTIGPGSSSRLIFTITNSNLSFPVGALAFTDTLPAGMTVSAAPRISSTCGGTVTAAAGSGTISFTGGSLGSNRSCTVAVDVTSATVGTNMNVSGNLTSDLGNSGPASADLTVVTDRPGFSKSFSPNPVPFGSRSTLTFTIDNSANAGFAFNLSFTDALPSGMVVASPANASSTCNFSQPPVVNAVPGSGTISHSSGGVNAGATCTVSVDVVAGPVGIAENSSGELTSLNGFNFFSSGKANAVLGVTIDALALIKSFLADPVLPGATVDLKFTLTNRSRSASATGITFTDNLGATLAGLAATGLPASNVCGAGSTLSGTSLLTLTGGNLAPGASCTFTVTLQVPAGATPGAYLNTTSSVTGDVGGTMVVGGPGTDLLFVDIGPSLTKTFLTNPVGAGDIATIEFTITNNSSTDPATDIAFTDNLTAFLGGATVAALPAGGFCGGGSTLTAPVISGDTILTLSGGNLASSGSCTFTVDIQLPVGISGGDFPNTTSEITAVLGGSTRTGAAATDTLAVVGTPVLEKSFTNDPVEPGNTVTLEFTLTHDVLAPGDATAIAFTDDLTGTLTGLTATDLPKSNICGAGSTLSGTTNLSLAGASLMPGESCVFSATLQVPAAALPGTYSNTTSDVMATVSGVAATGNGAVDNLVVSGLNFSKEWIDDPVIPGGVATLRFTLENTSPTASADSIFFTDNLSAVLPGLASTSGALNNICGAGSTISGTTFLIFSGGNLAPGTSCTFDIATAVPLATASNSYGNITSSLSAQFDGSAIVLPPVADTLVVSSELLILTKSFTDDPVAPGGVVNLEFTLTNLDAAQSATGITFTDDLDAVATGLASDGAVRMDVCGIGSSISGAGVLTFTGGSLAPGASCTFSVPVTVPAVVPASTLTNTTSQVDGTIGGLPVTGTPASDDLAVELISFSKSFDSVGFTGGTVSLTFSIQNQGSGPAATFTALGFLDNLGAALPGLAATGLPKSNVCGVGSTLSGTSVITLTGGSLLPGGSCTFSVDLQIPLGVSPSTFLNTTSNLTEAGAVAAPPATAVLTIEPPPTFAKSFAPATIGLGFTSTLTLTIDNAASTVAATAVDFTDNLPAGMVVATPSNASTTCIGGTLTAAAGASVITYTGGTVAAGATCTVQADVLGGSLGGLVNTTGNLTSSSGDSGTANATLTVVSPPTLAKSFAPTTIALNGVSTLTLTIDNSANPVAATGLSVVDTFPAALLVATPSNASTTCTGGTLTATGGTGSLSYGGGTVGAGASCTVQVDVTSAAVGMYVNTTGDLSSSLGTSPGASDTLEVSAGPTLAKSFAPTVIAANGVSTLTLTIDNSAAVLAATGLSVVDNFPAGMVVATPSNASTTCIGGTLTATSAAGSLSYSGGTVSAGATCTVQVDVTSATVGMHLNTTGDLSSSLGTAPGASDTLEVVGTPLFDKSFSTTEIRMLEPFGLVFTIDNSANVLDATGLDFTDVLPMGMEVASPSNASTTCTGGTVTAVAGSGTVAYTGGAVLAGAICLVQVDVVSVEPGLAVNTADLTSSLGTSPAASAAVTILANVLVIPTLDGWALLLLTLLLGGVALRRLW